MHHEIEQKFKKASSFEKEKKFLHAVQIYESLISSFPQEKYSYVRLANVYEELNNFAAAKNILAKCLANFSEDENLKIYFASFLIKNNFYEEASDILNEVSREENPEVFFLLGIINFNLNEYEISKIYFDQYTSLKDCLNLEEALLYLTKVSIKLNKIEEGLEYIKKAERLSALNYEVYLLSAQIYFFKEMNYHAYESIRKAVEINKESLSVNEWAGRILYSLEEYEKAEKHLRYCINTSEVSSEVFTMLGLTCKKNNKIEDANFFFGEALALNPNDKIAVNERINP